MTQAVDLQPLVYAMSADIRGLRRDLAKAKGETDRTVREIDARMKKPVSAEFMKDIKREVMASTTLTQRFGGAMAALGPGAMAAGLALGAAALGAQQFNAAMTMAAELDDAAQALQFNIEALQEYRYALVKAGGPAKDADEAIGSFTSKLGQAELGVKRALSWFEKLGFTQADLKSFASVEQALDEVMLRIGEVASASERAAIAEKLGLEKMIPVINRGGDALADFREEARKVGYVMSAEVAEKLADAEERAEVLGQVIRVNLASAFADLGPVVLQTLEIIRDVTNGIGDLINQVERFQARGADLWEKQPRWVQESTRWVMNRTTIGRETLKNWWGVDPKTGLPLKDRSNAGPDLGANEDRSATYRDANTWRRPSRAVADTAAGGGRSRAARRPSGPTPEELARKREELALEVELERAEAARDTRRLEALRGEEFIRRRTKEYRDAGIAPAEAETRAIQDRLAVLREEEAVLDRLASVEPIQIDITPTLDASAIAEVNAAFDELAADHQSAYADVISGAFDAARRGGAEGFLEWFLTRLGDGAFEQLSQALARAAVQAQASSASGEAGGFDWGSVLGAVAKAFSGAYANPGTMNAGQWGIAGEAGPEVFRAKPGGGVEFGGANRVRSLSMPKMPAMAARPMTPIIVNGPTYQLTSPVMTQDLLAQMNQMNAASQVATLRQASDIARKSLPQAMHQQQMLGSLS